MTANAPIQASGINDAKANCARCGDNLPAHMPETDEQRFCQLCLDKSNDEHSELVPYLGKLDWLTFGLGLASGYIGMNLCFVGLAIAIGDAFTTSLSPIFLIFGLLTVFISVYYLVRFAGARRLIWLVPVMWTILVVAIQPNLAGIAFAIVTFSHFALLLNFIHNDHRNRLAFGEAPSVRRLQETLNALPIDWRSHLATITLAMSIIWPGFSILALPINLWEAKRRKCRNDSKTINDAQSFRYMTWLASEFKSNPDLRIKYGILMFVRDVSLVIVASALS